MLHSSPQTMMVDPSASASKRNPFDLFASIFRRKSRDQDAAEAAEEETDNEARSEEITVQVRSSPVPISGNTNHVPDLSRSCSPASGRFRNVNDVAALTLSRQDNPYLQQQLERLSYQEEDPSCQSSTSTSPQKIPSLRSSDEIPDELCLGLHQHLIRSPPPQFPQNVSQFVFLSKSDSPQHYHNGSNWSDGGIVKSISVSPMKFDSVENMVQGQRIKDLNPLLTKTGMEALDPRVKEVLDFQRQKLYTDPNNFDGSCTNLNARRSSDISPVTQRMLSMPSKSKWLSKAGFRPTGSLPGLAGVNGDVDAKCLAPVKGTATTTTTTRQVTAAPSLVGSSSVQDLSANGTRKQGVFTVCGMTQTGSLEPLLSRSKSSLDSG